MSALLVGYARVSTQDQDLTAQRDALAALGVPVELRDDQRVSAATRGQRPGLREALAVGPGQAVVDVGALDRYAERCQRIALRGEVLILG